MRRPTFEAATKAFHQALRTNDADALFLHVADDVVLLPPGESGVHGKSAIWNGSTSASSGPAD